MLKTRDLYIIEAHVLFDIDSEIQCDESYNFPDDHLLLSTPSRHLKPLKALFSKNSKQEILQLAFSAQSNDPTLTFKGSLNTKFDYEIRKKQLGLPVLGSYLDNGYGKASQFRLNLGLKHLLALVKVCDLVEGGGSMGGGQAMGAMEQSGDGSCVCFLFTDGLGGEFRFIVGVGNVRFERLDEGTAGEGQRLRKGGEVIKSAEKDEVPAQKSEAPVSSAKVAAAADDAEMVNEDKPEAVEENAANAKERQEFYNKVD